MELLFLFVLALLVFGPRKLPEVARTAGKLMAELRRASNEFRYSLEDEIRQLDIKEAADKRALAPAPPPPPAGAVARPIAVPSPAVPAPSVTEPEAGSETGAA